ncbi:MAG: hypothetical protein ACLFP2_03125 [Candidatus Woesearchaeota archaeon]
MLKENDNEVVGTKKSLKKLGKYAEKLHSEAKRKVYEEKMSKLVNGLGGKQEKKKRKCLNF